MNEVQLRDGLLELFPPDRGSDWEDVLRRATRPRPRLNRLALLVLVSLVALLALGSALALSGRLGELFRGRPVNDLTPARAVPDDRVRHERRGEVDRDSRIHLLLRHPQA